MPMPPKPAKNILLPLAGKRKSLTFFSSPSLCGISLISPEWR